MKLCTFTTKEGTFVGVVQDQNVVALTPAYESYLRENEHDPDATQIARIRVPNDMVSLLQKGENSMACVRQALKHLQRNGNQDFVFPLDSVHLEAPVTNPTKIVCIGKAYMSHVQETDKVVPPDVMVAFHKAPTCLIGPKDKIVAKDLSQQLDYEIELAMIVGRRASNVPERDAYDYVAGFTVMNDVSYRNPKGGNSRTSPVAKSPDTFAPLGPWIVTPDEIKNPMDLRLRSFVNGTPRQDANTSTLLWDLRKMISFASEFMTLLPGDVFSTGTPGGNGIKDGSFLKEGDVVRCEIEGVGILENPVSAK